jgi:hypothetical protein
VILIIKLLKFELFLICNSFSRNWLRIIDENDDDVAETDEDYVHYYTDSQIISYLKENDYYKNSIANTIMIRFVSSDEVTETLKTFGVKLYKSKFYFNKQEGVIKDGVSTDNSNSDYYTWYEDFDFKMQVMNLTIVH